MAAGTRAGRSLAGDAAYGVLAELWFSLPLDVDAVREYLGLELRRESGLPAGIRGVLDVQERLLVVTDGLPQPAEEYVVLHEGGTRTTGALFYSTVARRSTWRWMCGGGWSPKPTPLPRSRGLAGFGRVGWKAASLRSPGCASWLI